MPTTPTSRTGSSSSPGGANELDSSTWKIFRQPGSVIAFASFDPATATGDQINASAFRKLTLNDELCRPKRVVVETTPDGQCTWRFVPNARWEEGVENEGSWPRTVDVCGQLMTLTHDQWDMYKLDRRYDCVVKSSPNHSVIVKSGREPSADPPREHISPLQNKNTKSKRRLSDNVTIRRLSGSNSEGRRKKSRAATVEYFSSSSSSSSDNEDDEAEEDEVNMIIDEERAPKKHLQSERLKKVRANIEEARKNRREWNARRREKLGLPTTVEDEDESMMSWSEINTTPKRPKKIDTPASKRKVSVLSEESDAFEDYSDDTTKPRFKAYEKAGTSKRTRTVSPGAARRAMELRRNRRGNRRKEELDRRAKKRTEARVEDEIKQLYEEGAKLHPSSSSSKSPNGESSTSVPQQTTPDEAMDEEAHRKAVLEESRRKIAELEKDKPLWDAQAQRRAAEEAKEKDRVEAARKARAASQAVETEQEKQRAQQHAEEAAQRKQEAAAADVRAKRKQAREAAQRDARGWLSRGWNARAALERYRLFSDAFDRLNFLRGDVVVFETVPWPVLLRPGAFGVEDVDWAAVEAFFRQVRVYMPNQEFVKLVEKSHKRFHPDRWRSRRVLHCVEDDEEKECLEVAANTVAQALTPLWQEVTGR
ncbi:hypothetical protein M0805_001687 [Coniferiporia weirii]|nr:hypothetical protein M0805_001687 [Coniferiporia weirii]